MKKFTHLALSLAFSMIATASAATADTGKVVDGCEIVLVEGTNYYNKADPTCVFASFPKSDKDDREAALNN